MLKPSTLHGVEAPVWRTQCLAVLLADFVCFVIFHTSLEHAVQHMVYLGILSNCLCIYHQYLGDRPRHFLVLCAGFVPKQLVFAIKSKILAIFWGENIVDRLLEPYFQTDLIVCC